MRVDLIVPLSKLIHLFPIKYYCLHGKHSHEPGPKHSLLHSPDTMPFLPTD